MAIIKLQGEQEKRKGIYYEVDASLPPIGEGGTGKVYEGRCINPQTGETRPVAIKFMFAELPEQIIERARREASIQLRNDNLIEMLGFIETAGPDGSPHYHVVSELLHGVSLSDIFDGKCADAKGNEIPYARKLLNMYSKDPDHFAKVVIKNVLSGLMALHDAGYIHRDIDPSNIMITDDEHIKLIDFGICKQMDKLTTHDKVQTVAGVFMGKPEYASPELALGDIKHQDQTTDIYAVGILMYQCIMGHVPFGGSRYEILDRQVKQRVPTKDIKNARLRRIIDKACEKKQEMRYQTSAEMRVDIESLDVRRAADPKKKRLMLVAAAVVLVLIAGAVIGMSQVKKNNQAEQAALAEKHTADSLSQIVTSHVRQGTDLARKGYQHDEGFDELLVQAKAQFDKADAAAEELRDMGVKPADYAADKEQLRQALEEARTELTEKAEVLEEDPDPVVVEECQAIRARINEIDKALKK